MTASVEVRTTQTEAYVITSGPTPEGRTTQAYLLTAINFPTVSQHTTQVVGQVAVKSDTSLKLTQALAMVAILPGASEKLLRAFTFTQDGHDFYVLRVNTETYVYDKLSGQWAQWKSPDADYWRAIDGCDWNGINVGIDPTDGKVYQIDPTGRLDYGTTPITSVIYTGLSHRQRTITPAYMGEVAVSQAKPPAGIDVSTIGVTLDSYDTVSWYNHGTIAANPSGSATFLRFYGLGVVTAPGRLFRITDTGYARRIDGFTVEISGQGQAQ